MSRVEVIGDCTLHFGDCLDVLPTLERSSAVVTDNPYGAAFNTDSRRFSGGERDRQIGVQGRADRLVAGDDEPFDPAPWLSWGEVILWGANYFAQRLPLGATLIWLKKYPAQYGTFLSDAEVGWQKGGCGVYALHAPDSPSRRRNEFEGQGGDTAHPTQKPIALMEWCVKRVSAARILDPYMGSGTTGVACINLGRPFIGIEKDETYFDIACSRIGAAHKQPRLFAEAPPTPRQEAML